MERRGILIEGSAVHSGLEIWVWLRGWRRRRLKSLEWLAGRDLNVITLAAINSRLLYNDSGLGARGSVLVSAAGFLPLSCLLALAQILVHQAQANPECEHLGGRE